MRLYFHLFPTCPDCHEPHKDGMPLKNLSNDYFRCTSCGANFTNRVDLLSSNRFKKTINKVIKNEGEDAKEYLSKIPLVWKIKPNVIENEYIQWLKNLESGKYLITWPWRIVKFLPLLIMEYLINNPNKSVVVIGDLTDDSTEDETEYPPVNNAFGNLIYLDTEEREGLEDTVKKEMQKFDRRFVLKKDKVVYFVIDRVGTSYRYEDISFDTVLKTKNRLIKEIEKDYGYDSVRNVQIKTLKKPKDKSEKEINPNGFIDIKLIEREQWSGDLHYRKKWLWDVLLNSGNIKRFSEFVSATDQSDVTEYDKINNRLFFISSKSEPEMVFNLVDKISPDLVLIQNTDDLIKDVIFGGKRSKALFNYLKNSDGYPVLMFSTEPGVRHLYGINYKRDFLVKYDIIPHTWDSECIIDEIKMKGKSESIYPNLISSRMEEISYGGKNPAVEYVETDSLGKLNTIIKIISERIIDEYVRKDIVKYFSDLKKSPLILKGDYENPEIFKRRGKHLDTVQYTYIMSILREKIEDDDEFNSLRRLLMDIYKKGPEDYINPLMDEIKNKINTILTAENSSITVVVHGYDVKGTEKILLESGYDEYMSSRLSICSWGNLSDRERELSKNTKHYVISTLPPSLAYSIYFGDVHKFIFIGSPDNVTKIETIIKNRLTETRSRPIHLLDHADSAPELLKNILDSIEIDSNEILKDITEGVKIDFEEEVGHIKTSPVKSVSAHPNIKSGENAVLVVDKNKKGMFISSGASLFIKEDHHLSEIQLDDISSSRELKNKLRNIDIIVDRQGVYVSFRSIFTKFIMLFGKSIRFRNGPYEWKGFKGLIEESLKWIYVLKDAVKLYSEKNKVSYEEAENEIAEYLSSLELTAKNPDYIKSWWSNYEIIETDEGIIHLPKVEHPRGLRDISKIYSGINKILPEMKLNPENGERIYIACLIIQNFRRSLLKGQIKETNPSMRQLYYRLEKEIKDLVKISPTFKVNLVYLVKIKEEVEPFRIMTNYSDFIETS